MQLIGEQQGNTSNLLSNALKGAVAGAVGVWVMDRLDWFMFRHEDQRARHQTEQVRPGGMDPAHVAANRMAHALGRQLIPSQPHPAGHAVHYALGVVPAAAYGAFRDQLPASPQGNDYLYGAGLGLGLFLAQDEVLNQAIGLSAKQKDYPWQAHARGFVAHLTLGLVTNAVLNLLSVPRPGAKSALDQRQQQAAQLKDDDFIPAMPNAQSQGNVLQATSAT